ncbi:hypothetical protein ACFCX6_22065 [Streptomyces sp. NPDC056353]|uniref:hypothetical protein n=1 Tax=Streptomyces TaxID=1883 RepID=UPI0021BD718C|nr:hypothetical protein [Streptomyces salinarius]
MRMLLHERPGLVIAFHDHFNSRGGGTSDMCLRALLDEVPVWLVSGNDVERGTWLGLEIFPRGRVRRIQAELDAARAVHHR